MAIFVPFFRYFSANSPLFPKATQGMKSALFPSLSFPLLNLLSTASVYLATQVELSPALYLISGSLVSLPNRITLFILFLQSLFIMLLHSISTSNILSILYMHMHIFTIEILRFIRNNTEKSEHTSGLNNLLSPC